MSQLPFSRPYYSKLSELSAANTSYDGTGTVVDATDVPATEGQGYEINTLILTLEEALTDSSWKIFEHDGTKFHMVMEVDLEPETPAAGTVNRQIVLDRNHATFGKHFPLFVKPGNKLGTALHTADNATVRAQGRLL